MKNPLNWLLPSALLPAALLGWWLLQPGRRLPHLTPTTEADGLGPVTLRRYWLDVQDATTPPEDVVQSVLDHFPGIMPRPLAFVRKVRGQPGQGRVADRYFLLLIVRRAWIDTDIREPLRFRNRTLRMHPESGWVEFSAVPSNSQSRNAQNPGNLAAYRLQITSRARSSTRADRLSYLLGLSVIQRLTWEIVLRRALKLSGGKAANHGHDTREFPYGAANQT